MKIIGIVGSSKIPFNSKSEKFIYDILHKLKNKWETVIVTGDATGVDAITRTLCLKYNLQHSVIYSKLDKFEGGYKQRNKIIADYCDEIISIALPVSKTPCYHCNSETHERTGGCYTGKLNGNYKVLVMQL